MTANGSVYSVLKLSPLFVRLVSDLISLILKTGMKKVKKPDLFIKLSQKASL